MADWLAYTGWPSAVFTVSVLVVAISALGSTAAGVRARGWWFAALGLLGVPVVGLDADGNPVWTLGNASAVVIVVAISTALGVAFMIRKGRALQAVANERTRLGAIVLLSGACAAYGWVSVWCARNPCGHTTRSPVVPMAHHVFG